MAKYATTVMEVGDVRIHPGQEVPEEWYADSVSQEQLSGAMTDEWPGLYQTSVDAHTVDSISIGDSSSVGKTDDVQIG